MKTWRILITDQLHESGISILQKAAQVDYEPGIEPEELLQIIPKYDALVIRGRTRVIRPVLEAGIKLRVIGRAGVGVENIDLATAQAKHITVINAPTATTLAVAELTFGLIFSLLRAIPKADASMKTGIWRKKDFIGTELAGKTLGIIGVGRIGTAVAQRAAPFSMGILGHDPLISIDEIQSRGAKPVTLDDLYANADIISLHLPLNPDTRGLIDGHALTSMKRGVYLISTARGGIIDETALLARLESGQVAGAALDVFSQEPPGLSALVAHPNVIATPHVGAQTAEAQERAAVHIAEETVATLHGEPLRWKIV
jgi:D-3-phosphoglycerate dehydrogenase